MRAIFSTAFVGVAGVSFYAFGLWPGLPRLSLGIMIVALVTALPIAVGGLGTGQAAFLMAFEGVAEPERLLVISLTMTAGMITLRVGRGLAVARDYAREALEHRDD